MRGRRLWAVAAAVIVSSTGAAPDEAIEANLKVVGRLDLGAPVSYGEVTAAGSTAIVATHAEASPCAGAAATMLDIKDARRPKVVATIPLPEGTRVADLDSATLLTPSFTGDLLAVLVTPCTGTANAALSFFDVSDPAAPVFLAQTAGGSAVSLAQRSDGRAVAVKTVGAGVEVMDLSDPARPATIARWQDAGTPATAPCMTPTAQTYDDGESAVVTLAGGRLLDLDLSEPSQPFAAGATDGAGSGSVGVLPLGQRTIVVVAEGDSCPGEPGLRVFALRSREALDEEAPVRYPGAGTAGRLVASGTLAYVAWHSAGLRVVDFAEVKARTVAQFAPAHADVVGVALLPEHLVVSDAAQGLFVLERPDEGGGRATFWSQFLGFLPYLGFAIVAAAALVVPRMLASRAGATVGMPAPGAEPVRRRRA